MNKITIAVGSKRGPKLNAVTEALQLFSVALRPDAQFEVVGVEVESGVSHTPASRDELMRGARQRAEALLNMVAPEASSCLKRLPARSWRMAWSSPLPSIDLPVL